MKTTGLEGGIATLLQEFFLQRLTEQRNASTQTIAAYRDSFQWNPSAANKKRDAARSFLLCRAPQ